MTKTLDRLGSLSYLFTRLKSVHCLSSKSSCPSKGDIVAAGGSTPEWRVDTGAPLRPPPQKKHEWLTPCCTKTLPSGFRFIGLKWKTFFFSSGPQAVPQSTSLIRNDSSLFPSSYSLSISSLPIDPQEGLWTERVGCLGTQAPQTKWNSCSEILNPEETNMQAEIMQFKLKSNNTVNKKVVSSSCHQGMAGWRVLF